MAVMNMTASMQSCCTRRAFFGAPATEKPWQRMQRQLPCIRSKNSGRITAFFNFKFGNRGLDSEGAGIYGSQKRDDYNRDDVEQYFNYMGMLATEGTYDKMDALLNEGIHPVDILLLMAASEGDKPKIEELLRAGASYEVKDAQGKTALDRAKDDEIREFIPSFKVTTMK